MACNCGHNKKYHQYERDTQDKMGRCSFVEITNINRKIVCGCKSYRKQKVCYIYEEK